MFDEQASKDPLGSRRKMIVVEIAHTACKMIRKKSGLQSHLSFLVTAYTLNRATNFTSVQTCSNLKRMSRPHCDRRLSGKSDDSHVCRRDPYGASAADKPLSGLRIGGGEIDSHLRAGS